MFVLSLVLSHSTEDVISDVMDYINNFLDKGDNIGIFLDLAKVFNTMKHKILLSKLDYLG